MEWEEYFKQEPWGSVRDDLRAGQVCSIIAAAHGAKDVSAADFFSTIPKPEARTQTIEEMKAILRSVGVKGK